MHQYDDIQSDLPFDPAELLQGTVQLCNPAVSAKMAEMLSIQDSLNKKFIGDNWKLEAAKHGRVDYLPTILDEAAEMLRSTPQWKFWKKATTLNLENAKLELIDMLHFAMSEELAKCGDEEPESDAPASLAEDMSVGYEFAYQTVSSGREGELPAPGVKPEFNFQRHKSALFRYLASVFLYYEAVDGTSSDAGQGDFEQDPVGEDEAASLGYISDSMRTAADWTAFWEIALHLGMTLEEVYLTYIAKVSLNELRITRGDKTGNYVKLWWGGQEDNFFLMKHVRSILSNGSHAALNRESMSAWLNSAYDLFLSDAGEPVFQQDSSPDNTP